MADDSPELLPIVNNLLKTFSQDESSAIISRQLIEKGVTKTRELIKFISGEKEKTAILERYIKHSEYTNSFNDDLEIQLGIIPALEEILSTVSSDYCPLTQRLLAHDRKEQIMILEDLKAERFKDADPDGLHLGQCIHVAQALANFHAASIVLLHEQPDRVEKYRDTGNATETLFANFEHVIQRLESISHKNWSEKLKRNSRMIQENIYDQVKFLNVSDYPVVLINGNLALANTMLRYRGCGTWDIQFNSVSSLWAASPLFNLADLIFTLPKNSIIFQEIDAILQAYHARFTQLCLLLAVPLDFTSENLKNDMTRILSYSFMRFVQKFATAESPDLPVDCLLEGLAYFEKQGLFD